MRHRVPPRSERSITANRRSLMADLKEQGVRGKFGPYAMKRIRKFIKCLNDLSATMPWGEHRMLNDFL